jgi:SHAQKYF class myb-like DNA-binding protein
MPELDYSAASAKDVSRDASSVPAARPAGSKRKTRAAEEQPIKNSGKNACSTSTDSNDTSGGNSKKPRFVWTEELHTLFIGAIFDVGLKHAIPKTTCDIMKANHGSDAGVPTIRSYMDGLRGIRLKTGQIQAAESLSYRIHIKAHAFAETLAKVEKEYGPESAVHVEPTTRVDPDDSKQNGSTVAGCVKEARQHSTRNYADSEHCRLLYLVPTDYLAGVDNSTDKESCGDVSSDDGDETSLSNFSSPLPVFDDFCGFDWDLNAFDEDFIQLCSGL